MTKPAAAYYDARWGYRDFDADRYERRRYGGVVRGMNLRLLERALARALADVPSGSLVLDAPCGTGILEPFLRARGYRVIGADIGQAMLGVAARRGLATGLVRGDLERPPFRPGAVGAVVSSRFLMHLPPAVRPQMLRTLASITTGPVVGTVCHPYTWKSFGRSLRRKLGGRAKKSPRLTRAQVAAEAAAAGLILERVIPVLPLLSEVWVVVLRTPPTTS